MVAFANIFSIVEPVTSGNYDQTLWMIAGPTLFSAIALGLYARYDKRTK